MPIGVAVIDANLLVPIVACDFLLTAFDHGVFELIVSSTVLDEVERTLIDDFPDVAPDGLRRRVAHMRAALADQIVDPAGFEGSAEMINVNDRHVVAAALAVGATWVVTDDGALRSEIAGSGLNLQPLDGNAFVLHLWEVSPTDMAEVVHSLIAKRRRPAVSPSEMAAQLHVHFPAMTAAWLARIADERASRMATEEFAASAETSAWSFCGRQRADRPGSWRHRRIAFPQVRTCFSPSAHVLLDRSAALVREDQAGLVVGRPLAETGGQDVGHRSREWHPAVGRRRPRWRERHALASDPGEPAVDLDRSSQEADPVEGDTEQLAGAEAGAGPGQTSVRYRSGIRSGQSKHLGAEGPGWMRLPTELDEKQSGHMPVGGTTPRHPPTATAAISVGSPGHRRGVSTDTSASVSPQLVACSHAHQAGERRHRRP